MTADFDDEDDPTFTSAEIVGAMKVIGVIVVLALAGLVLWMLIG